jgi:hypothetical protein
MTILFYLKSLPRLFALTIDLKKYSNPSTDLSKIYRIILHLPFLKYNSLIGRGYELSLLLPLAINERFSTIEYLVMEHSCGFNELISILYHTPKLRHLTCRELSESGDDDEIKVSTMLSSLTYLSMKRCNVEFEEFEKFVKKTCSQLKALYIWDVFGKYSVEPDQWKRLILQNMPQLRRFDLKCHAPIGDNVTDIDFDSFVHQFTSQFWIERGWITELQIQPEKIYYSINSTRYYKKKILFFNIPTFFL